MMDSLNLHSKLNNRAVECLKNGDFQKAVELFKASLTNIATEVKKCPQQKAVSNASSGINPFPSAYEEYLPEIRQDTYQAESQSEPHPQAIGDAIHVQCFQIADTSEACFSSEPIEDKKIRSAIIVFNLAILFHLKSMRENSNEYLTRAKTLYEKSHQLIVGILGGLGTTGPDYKSPLTGNAVIDLLVMALNTNLAQISLELKDFATGELLFGQVIRCALHIQKHPNSYSMSGRNVSAFMHQQSQFFLLNAAFCRVFHVATAPAA